MKKSKSSSSVNPLEHQAAVAQGAVKLPAASDIPAVPEGYIALASGVRQALLKLAGDQKAEVDQAMEQLWQKRASIQADLGTLSPDAEKGKTLHERMLTAREVNRLAEALVAFTNDQEALGNNAVMAYLNEVAGDISHVAGKNPQIATRYDKVLAVAAQRRQAISDGRARAKAAKGGTGEESGEEGAVAPAGGVKK